MMTAIATLKMMLSNKWFIYGALILALLFGLYLGASRVYNNGYDSGIAHQIATDKKEKEEAQNQFNILQTKADGERAALNKKITALTKNNSELKAQLTVKERKTDQERIDYAKTTAGTMSCFAPNDSGLFIINNSFPSVSGSVQSNSNGTN